MNKLVKTLLYIMFGASVVSTSAGIALSNDLYVSGNGTGIVCSITEPCTFPTAQNKAVAGDVIHVLGTIGSINIIKSDITIQGGVVDGSNNTSQDSASILITGNNVTIRDTEIINGHSYGVRTYNINYGLNARLDNVTVHHNVLENFYGSNGCNMYASSGWGSGVRAYRTNGFTITNSRIYENCGEGLSSVMSQNVVGSNLEIRDNFSVNVYPDQSQHFTVTDSVISCTKPEYQRFGMSYALLLGAESYSGVSTNTEDYIDFERNKIYNCKGVGTYSTTGNTWKNITIINNEFYNVPSPAIASISGTNILTNPNTISSLTPAPVTYTATSVKSTTPTLTRTPASTFTQTPMPLFTLTPTLSLTSSPTTTSITPTPTRCKGNPKHCRTPQP